jgi:peptide/nickel transport system ATP-binding protein
MSSVLEVRNLTTVFHTSDGLVRAVDDISFSVEEGKTVAIVGESGCGKSVAALSITRLLSYPGVIKNGSVLLNGVDLVQLSEKEMKRVRGNDVAMIFQEPMTSLNPVLTVGEQIAEIFRHRFGMKKAEAKDKSIEMINLVGIPRASTIFYNYPHQLSGGMRQRIVIAMALSCDPSLLIADEPTTALDVTIQAQILELMDTLIRQKGKSMIFITHDLGVVAEIADSVIVMYAGKIVELASVKEIFRNPCHPYTSCLLASLPDMKTNRNELYSIPGMVPNLLQLPKGCSFNPRCPFATQLCEDQMPELKSIKDNHLCRCFFADQRGKNVGYHS